MKSPARGPAVVVSDVWKSYRLWHERRQSLKERVIRGGRGRFEDFWALRAVSFEVERGETFGVIGANGSGKSTLLKVLSSILEPNRGEVVCHGRISALLELGAGFHPELTGRENIFLNGSILGLKRKQLTEKIDSIVEFAGLDSFIDSPIRSYSSGMAVRLGFAVAVHSEPDILLVDEVLAVGDAEFQQKSAERILEIRDRGATIVVVSHSLDLVRGLCDRAVCLEHGEVVSEGLAVDVVSNYLRGVSEHRADEAQKEADKAEEGQVRWGTGAIFVHKVEVESPLRSGEPATFRILYRCPRRIERPVFAVGIETLEGVLVATTNTADDGYVVSEVQGEGVVEVTLQDVPLVAGRYRLGVWVTDKSRTIMLERVERAAIIEVQPGGGPPRRGVMVLPGRWRAPAIRESQGV